MEGQNFSNERQQLTPEPGPFDVSHPLRGVVLCCTSIPPEKRPELASQTEQMGGKHKYDLTSEITHLIVGDYDTPKYRYVARERPDIKVLTSQWVEAVRQLWMEDKAIDLAAIEREYALPTFATLRICMTGFEDQEQRQGIIEQVNANGGEYHGDLTRKVTHLIAHKPEGAKYKHAKTWGLHVVTVEWLQDSLERGMILDEKLYNPEWPVEERGKGAWARSKRVSLGKRSRDASVSSMDEWKRKLRRTASTKLTSQNERIWGDIVGGGMAMRAASRGDIAAGIDDVPLQRETITEPNGCPPPDPAASALKGTATIEKGTFVGCAICIHGFDKRKTQVVEAHVRSHKAEVIANIDDLVNDQARRLFIVVPHSMLASKSPKLPPSVTSYHVVNEWWVERCIEAKSLIPPADYIFGCLFPAFPLDGFAELTICSTGFDGLQLRHLSKAVPLLGAKYEETFSKEISVLICNAKQSVRREKIKLAHEWNMPVVSLDWLTDSIQKEGRQLFRPYILRAAKKTKMVIGPMSSDEKEAGTIEMIGISRIKNEDAEVDLRQEVRAAEVSWLDRTAFQHEPHVNVKEEEPSTTSAFDDPPEPLVEISANSPRKQSSSSKSRTPSVSIPAHPGIPPEDISTAISSLLVKSKFAPAQPHDQSDQTSDAEGTRKKRAPSKILGRAASNVSAASAPLSRASSVDSTASVGQAVLWPVSSKLSGSAGSEQRSSSSLRSNLPSTATASDMAASETAIGPEGDEEDSQPPQTQMQYDDAESRDHKARLLARARGEKIKRQEVAKVVTIGSLDEGRDVGTRLRNGRALRDRKSSGLR